MAAGLRCGSSTIKYLLFFFNFIFSLFGLAILVLGILGCTKSINTSDLSNLRNSFIVLCIVGGAIFVIAFCGCCGAVRESNCLLVTFAVLLLTIIVCEVVLAIVIFVNLSSIDDGVAAVFNDALKNKNAASMESVDFVQGSFQCCGLKDASFWGSNQLPNSCCSDGANCTPKNAYTDGCANAFSKLIKQLGKSLGAVAIALAVVEVIGVWFALALAGEIKRLGR
ncbi:Leukocyte surface antigen CD53 [Frankliniella fusca]|uniref:Tetraspanin n=2 Tax=Arthropoda TaxID=6656 RepID=A0AAE1GW75_9NEOP|nr:Leukocyte surface antigen CD53 [Frankliniella fusca]